MEQNVVKKGTEKEGAIERTRQQPSFTIPTDIVETADQIVVWADMPGVEEKAVDVTVEKNVLRIHGAVTEVIPNGYARSYAEYETGDYERVFTLPEEIDQNQIEAKLTDGVLKIVLPKAEPAAAKKIKVKTG